jgi:sugar-specific transcriptional regulator TrmB
MADAILAQLRRIGIPGYEAKAYIALLEAGRPMNGYEVAKASGVPRSTVYETLTKLVRRGIAFEVRPENGQIQYVALSAGALVSRLRRDFDESLDDLDRGLDELGQPTEAGLVLHLRGADALLKRAEDLIQHARDSLFISAWPEHFAELNNALQAADARGVNMWISAWGGANPDIGHVVANSLTTPGSPLDRTDWVLGRVGSRLVIVVADRRTVLTAGTTDRDSWGVVTDDPALVVLALETIVHYMVADVLISAIGPTEFLRMWEADAALMSLGTGTPQPHGRSRRRATRS